MVDIAETIEEFGWTAKNKVAKFKPMVNLKKIRCSGCSYMLMLLVSRHLAEK